MPVKRLIERVSTPFAGASVDREQGIIRGVKLCGGCSANGRDYPAEVFRRDAWKYEGAAVYADHGRERTVDRKLGWIASPRVDADGTPRGDAHLLKSHPLYDRVMEAAERNPALFGFSHVALCDTSMGADGRERVDELRAIESVDLVAEPATTAGLFESRVPQPTGQEPSATSAASAAPVRRWETVTPSEPPISIAGLATWVTRHPRSNTRQILAARRLAEMDAGAMGDVPAAATWPPDEMDPMDAITGGFQAAIASVVDQVLQGGLDTAAGLKKIKTLFAAHASATMPDRDGDASDALEWRLPAAASRERPTSSSRHQVARLTETSDASNAIPQDGPGFARWVAD